jgi:hypothetical protein
MVTTGKEHTEDAKRISRKESAHITTQKSMLLQRKIAREAEKTSRAIEQTEINYKMALVSSHLSIITVDIDTLYFPKS